MPSDLGLVTQEPTKHNGVGLTGWEGIGYKNGQSRANETGYHHQQAATPRYWPACEDTQKQIEEAKKCTYEGADYW